MELADAWLLFPAILLVLAAGWGELVARVSGTALPAALILPTGFAAIVVVSGLVTLVPRLAQLTAPLVVAGAAGGLAAGWPWHRPGRSLAWPAAAATVVFACYAAPIVLSGQATFAGYLTLDDTATLFAMTDRMLEAGRTLHGLAPSTYELTLATSLMVGYPMGSLLPLGVGAKLSGQDIAWVFQPYLAVVAGMLALVLWHLLRAAIPRRAWRLLAVLIAAQPAILFAYGLWTGVKELTAALLIALTGALVFELGRDSRARSWLPPVTAAAATVCVLSLGGGIWLVPLAVWFAVERRAALRLRTLGPAAALFIVLALPAVVEGARFLGNGHSTSWSDAGHLANLIQALNPLQVFGIWPSGDFRFRPDLFWQSVALALLVAALALGGLARALRSRDPLLPYVACALLGGLALWILGSPWIGGKALATASPALLALAASACAWLAGSGRRVEAVVATALVAGGVLWSNALAFSNVNLAPRPQLAELQSIGDRFDDQGPALMTEYLPVGVRHFLRGLDSEGAAELRVHQLTLQNGSTLPKLEYANLDDFQLGGILYYRTLVIRRSPTESRPPSPYTLRFEGRYYEVWQRPSAYRAVIAQLPLGSATNPGAVPSCAAVEQLATHGTAVAAVPRNDQITTAEVPAPGQTITVTVTRPGLFSFWLGGSTRDTVQVLVDGKAVGTGGPQLNNLGQYVELARARLGRGRHTVGLSFEDDSLRPGTGGPDYGSGPLVVSPASPVRAVVVLPSAEARRLCGRRLDWVEALA